MTNQWATVATAVKQRRLVRDLSQRAAAAAAGVSATTWQSLELHEKPVNDLTKAGIARALHWPIDAIDRIMDGEDPGALPTVEPEPRDQVDWNDLTSSLSEEDRAIVRSMIERLRQRG